MVFLTPQKRPARAGRPILVLSALALLAFACVPAVAAANSGIQYNDAPPTVTGERAPSGQEPPAGKSNAGGGSGTGGGKANAAGGSDNQSGGAKGKQGGSAGADGARDGGKQGRAGGNSADGGGDEAEAISAVPASGSDGGSSPLVPILIAIAVLAAISVGAVMIRRHRGEGSGGEDSGPDVSPEAG